MKSASLVKSRIDNILTCDFRSNKSKHIRKPIFQVLIITYSLGHITCSAASCREDVCRTFTDLVTQGILAEKILFCYIFCLYFLTCNLSCSVTLCSPHTGFCINTNRFSDSGSFRSD